MDFYTFLPKILNMSLTASVAIVFVLLLRLLLKKAPKVISYALWGVVLIRLLCPVSIESGLSLFGLFDTPTTHMTERTSAVEYIPSNIVHTEYPEVVLPVPGIGEAITEVLPQGEEQLRADPMEAPMSIATYVWMGGILVMATYGIVTYLRLRRKSQTASPLRENIWLADGIESPFVMGLIRPKIYLPSAMEEREQSYIILHEQHHIRRLDHIVKAMAFVALCIHWFNPMVWVAFILSGKDMEMSCDEAVVRKLGTEIRADYSASLLSLATGKRIIAGMPLAFGEGNTKSRIKNLANWKKPAFWVVLVAVVACIVLAVCLLTNPAGYRVDFSNNEIVSATCFDVRSGDDETLSKNLNQAQIDELMSRLKDVKNTKRSSEYAGFTPGYQISAKLQDDTYIRVSGYSLDKDNMVDIEHDGQRYVVSDKDFCQYLSRVCAGCDTIDATMSEIIPGTTYVSWQCLYMNPLSSYFAAGGDSGCKYVVGDDYFAIYRRADGNVISITTDPGLERPDTAGSNLQSMVDVPNWEWQPFPYADEEWAALYQPGGFGGMQNIHELYDEILYQPLVDGQFLLRVDGDLWIVELRNNPQMGTYLWSIYSLVPESSMGVAQWEYAPMLSSRLPVFRFVFDLDYDEISAVCTESDLVAFDEEGTPSDSSMLLEEGEALHWSPLGEDGVPVTSADIHFSVHKDSIMTYAGTIYIESSGGSNHGRPVYTASLLGTGLHLSPNTETEGGVISAVNASVGSTSLVTEHDLRNGGLEVDVEDLDQYVFFTNSTKIAIEVEGEADFNGEIVLHDISQSGEGIQFAKVNTKDNEALFSNLTSARMYRLSCEGLDVCKLVITEK